MKTLFLAIALAFGLAPAMASAEPPKLLAQWVQMAPGGGAEARVVVEGSACPDVVVDRASLPMHVRAAPDEKFLVALCTLILPPLAQHASVMGQELRLPLPSPNRILVLGDTGCRIKGGFIQACNDPKDWPFPQVAANAARLKPDLVLHVGDYLYRELACPAGNPGCAGSPWGDNWTTWDADFFTPGRPLLAAAPWVIVRGNHEECDRSGTGFLRLLGPQPFVEGASCIENLAPYAVPLGDFTLAVIDNANAIDCCLGIMRASCWFSCGPSDDLVETYRKDLAVLPTLSDKPMWLAMHHPIWGVVKQHGLAAGGNATLISAEKETGLPANLDLMLAGHIHTFEAINYEKGLPPQLISGEGGDRLDEAPADLTGKTVLTAKIANGFSLPGYGFLLLTRMGQSWKVDIFDASGTRERSCMFADRHLDCPKS